MKLKTETNTRAMERRVLKAFRTIGIKGKRPKIDAFFEHGQWWVTHLPSGAQWSAADCTGGRQCEYGFTFEQVSEGDDWR